MITLVPVPFPSWSMADLAAKEGKNSRLKRGTREEPRYETLGLLREGGKGTSISDDRRGGGRAQGVINKCPQFGGRGSKNPTILETSFMESPKEGSGLSVRNRRRPPTRARARGVFLQPEMKARSSVGRSVAVGRSVGRPRRLHVDCGPQMHCETRERAGEVRPMKPSF